MRNNDIPAVQVIRGCAALLVLLYHASSLIKLRFNYDITSYFWWGYSGVDIFFVLSGFIITYSTLIKPSMNKWEFLARRILRIFPIYWMALCFVLGLIFVGKFFSVSDSGTLDRALNLNFKDLVATFFLIPKSTEILLVAWTLSFEMTFYVLFAFLFFKNRKLFFYVMGIWALVCLLTAFYFKVDYQNTNNSFLAMLNPIMIEFLLGCGLAYLFYVFPKLNYIPNYYIVTAFIMGILLYAYSPIMYHDYLKNVQTLSQNFRFILFGVPASYIMLYMLYLPIKYPKLFTFLGDASYSLYLFHYPVLGIVAKALIFLGIRQGNVGIFLGVLLLTISICSLIYLFIENPILEFGKNRIRKIKYQLAVEKSI